MTFDKPEHKQLTLELLKAAQIPMTVAKIAAEFIDAVERAEITWVEPPKPDGT